MDLTTYARLVTIDTGQRVRAARESQGVSHERLARLTGYPVEVLIDLEDGAPKIGMLLRELTSVFTALGLDLTTTVEQAGEAVRTQYGAPEGLPPKPRTPAPPSTNPLNPAAAPSPASDCT